MINVDFTNIDNARLIGRLLPFWARGRWISLFLQAIISPLASLHKKFKAWALERFIECHITAQKMSLEWYLRYKLKKYFVNPYDSFHITNGINQSTSCFSTGVWRNELYWNNDLQWDVITTSYIDINGNLSTINTGLWENDYFWNNDMVWEDEENGVKFNEDFVEAPHQTNVYAPAIVDTVNYNHEDYERDIRNIMAKYMINFNRIKIIIAGETN